MDRRRTSPAAASHRRIAGRSRALRGIAASVAASAVAAVLATVPAACRTPPADPSTVAPARPVEPGSGRPSPSAGAPSAQRAVNRATRLVLTPLSHVATSGGSPVLNLRIDAFDAAGAPARMAGILRVGLASPGADPERCVFDVPLETRAQESKHFDEVLGQYVIRVAPAWMRIPSRDAPLEVTATLLVADGTTVAATGRVAW
jgi:hypothetical protein